MVITWSKNRAWCEQDGTLSIRAPFGRPQKWPKEGSFLRPKTSPIELRVEVHHCEAKMVFLNSQFDRSCLGALWQPSEMDPKRGFSEAIISLVVY
eukprot:gene18352-biopygen635